jgi:hypothetical protein
MRRALVVFADGNGQPVPGVLATDLARAPST